MNTIYLEELPYQLDSCVWFERLRKLPDAVFLDSAYPFSSAGRYDILAAEPNEKFVFSPTGSDGYGDLESYFHDLESIHQATIGEVLNPSEDIPFCGGLLGYLSYDTGCALQGLSAKAGDAGLASSVIGFYPWCLLQDHLLQRALFVALPQCDPGDKKRILEMLRDPMPYPAASRDFKLHTPFSSNLDESTYKDKLAKIQHYILEGDCYQVNFAQRFSTTCEGDPWQAYLALRQVAGADYSAFLNFGDSAILSLSPEQFVRLRGSRVETRPIKGTRPRGTNPEIDELLARELLNSEKDRAENLMIVDLLRNDLGKRCTPGSIRVDKLFELQALPNVHHLVSTISGDLPDTSTAIELLRDCFPGGSITGAPKLRAMEIIDELESNSRGAYCGSVIYISADGNMDSNIAIRTMQCRGGEISCWGGGGIVADSDWQMEYRETHDKVGLLLRQLQDQFLTRKT